MNPRARLSSGPPEVLEFMTRGDPAGGAKQSRVRTCHPSRRSDVAIAHASSFGIPADFLTSLRYGIQPSRTMRSP